MKILGISAYFHDSSACLVVDGKIIATVTEERLSRIKHDSSFPQKSINYCLENATIEPHELDEVVFFEKPLTKFERILETFTKVAPFGFFPFRKAIQSWISKKLWIEDNFRKKYNFKGKFSYCQHHLSHAALANYSSNFQEACYVVIDGVGEKACTSFGVFENGKLTPLKEQHFPHSIGLLYSAFTYYCGFKVNSGEYKLMGLAPYGQPIYTDKIKLHLVKQSKDGSIELNLKYFAFHNNLKMINRRFEQLFGKNRRKEEDTIDAFYKDIAASIQKVTEELVLNCIRFALKETGKTNLVYGGGVALNCVINSKLKTIKELENVYIHSSSGDSGCAIGAALWTFSENQNKISSNEISEFLGPNYNNDEIKIILEKQFRDVKYNFQEFNNLFPYIAQSLHNGKIVAWFQGALEMGPRALGNRSILANPTIPDIKRILNQKIKKREGFRPFAPVVLAEDFSHYFIDEQYDYSKMIYTAQATSNTQSITSCIHEDNSARVQKLEKKDNEVLYNLLQEFKQLSDIPILINTSFNQRGEPMVCSPENAIHCFFNTEIDILVMENYVILKDENKHIQIEPQIFALD